MRNKLKVNRLQQLLTGIFLFLLLCSLSRALNPGKISNEYQLDHWNISNGLPSNLIHSIAQTPDGYLWIATNKGLLRYDGINFSIVSFAKQEEKTSGQTAVPLVLYLDKSKKLWIGSTTGLTAYDYKTTKFKTFTPEHGLSKGNILRLGEDMKGNLWIGFGSYYINRFSEGKFTTFNESHGLKGKKVHGIIEDHKGNLLVGTRENGVFKYRDGKFTHYPLPGLKGFLVNMVEDRQGNLWISTSKGLTRKTGQAVKTYTGRDGLCDDHIAVVREDSQQDLWIGTINGLNRIKKKQDGSVVFECILESFIIISLFEDREGSLWVGTYDSGLLRLKDVKFRTYTPLQKHPGEILFSICEGRSGDLWIGTAKGNLYRFRSRKLIEEIQIPGVSGTGISAIIKDDDGNPWLGTNGNGVFKKKTNTIFQYTTRDGLADNLVIGIYKDSRSNLWFSTFDGVSVLSPHDNTMESLNSRGGLSGKKIHNVYEDKTQNIWIAADNGITVLKGGKIDRKHMKYYLKGITVTWIYEDPSPLDRKNRIFWLATHGSGLKRLRLEDRVLTTYTTAQGMTTNFIYQFFEDQQGNFWLMSDSGILRVSKAELNRFARNRSNWINCTSFGISDGLLTLEYNNPFPRHSALKTQNGELWFLSMKGISIVNPDKIRINKVPPSVIIEKAFFNQTSISRPLPSNANTFKAITDLCFHFNAVTLLSAEKVTFKYQLQGFDQQWTFLGPGKKRTALYKNLEPGVYTFNVTAGNAEGVWNTTGASFTFILKPPFLKSPIFRYFLLPLFLVLLVLLTIALYRKKSREKPLPGEQVENIEKQVMEINNKIHKGDGDSPPKSSLENDYVEVCLKKIMHLVEIKKVYLDEGLTLRSLAEKLKMPYYQLSEILNKRLNRKFNDFINHYRIEEARRILESSEAHDKTIVSVAMAVGFKSTTSFYQVFKKYTGMTPSRYKQEAQKKK
jgi:ligand-binding sensor domain-containing protein/AraC-like DNA-binding protein